MRAITLSLLLAASASASAAPHDGPGDRFTSKKSLATLQKCLTDKLARLGDVTDVTVDDITTLMIREGPDDPVMVIDLAPPSVTVTTPFLVGSRKLVKACL